MLPRLGPWVNTVSVVSTATTAAIPADTTTRLIMACSFAGDLTVGPRSLSYDTASSTGRHDDSCTGCFRRLSYLRYLFPQSLRIAAAARRRVVPAVMERRAAAPAPLAGAVHHHVRRPETGSKSAAGGLVSTTQRKAERDSSSSRWAPVSTRRRVRT